jgi:DNA-binding NtrC family response regulator
MHIYDSDHHFLEGVRTVAFSNPFAKETYQIHRKLVNAGPELSQAEVSKRIHNRLKHLVIGIENSESRTPARKTRVERETLIFAKLYLLLLDFLPEIDRYILKQIEHPRRDPGSFPVGAEMFERLQQMGYSVAEAGKRVAILYQIRRGYYFLDRGLVGQSPSMVEVRRRLWNNIFTSDIRWYVNGLWEKMEDFSLLLLGETGCGKGAAAAAVGRSAFIPYDTSTHRFAQSFHDTFQEINLSQFAPGVLESELFGHKKGAFTGAIEHFPGLLGQCPEYGSVFLDEIGDVSTSIQLKLLRVLQERTFQAVGSRESKRFRGRVIAATNHSLSKLRASGEFRDDFYYRLSSDCIEVPSLSRRISERPEELSELAFHLLRKMSGREDSFFLEKIVSNLLQDIPKNYAWPGNVRELEQALRRTLISGTYSGDRFAQPEAKPEAWESGGVENKKDLIRRVKELYERSGSYADVSRLTGLDRRTVKKYVTQKI